jgi:glycosyltransferase involved in cell wall biosynthesis
MRVVLCGPYPVDLTRRPGGVISATIYLAQGLSRSPDVDLHVVAPTKEIGRDQTVEADNATIHYLAAARHRLVPNLLTNIKRIRRKIEEIDPDIVHSEGQMGTLASLRAGYPTVDTIHGISYRELRYASGAGRKAAVWLEGYLGKKALRSVTHAIPTSQYAADAYEGMTNAKMHLVYNPIDDAFLAAPNEEEPGRLLFGGNVIERKNVMGHLEVVRRLVGKHPNIRLRVAGGTPESDYFEECKAFVARHKLDENVMFLGVTPLEQMLEEHSRAAMLLLLSKQETAPLIISEALCAGKPVVASTAGGNAELVKHGETGYVAPWGDNDSFAGYVDTLLSDDGLRQEMGRNAREDARERFSIAAVTAQTIEVYREVIAGR